MYMLLADAIAYDDKVSSVREVQFAVLSPDEIIEQSVAHIYKQLGKKGASPTGTLDDPRLGATRDRVNSITGLSLKRDPGNFGHCILAKPVYHPLFFDYVKRVMGSICMVCSSLTVSYTHLTLPTTPYV